MAPGYAAGVIISNAYSTGRVQGETIVGGLVGSFYGDDSVIQNTYSTSSVGATASGGVTGAVVGKYSGDGTIKNSYFAVNSSSISTGTGEYESSGVTRLTNSSEISQQAINSGWSPEIWDFTTGSTPVLKELTNTYSKSVSAGTVVINDTEINISSGSIEDAINTINAKTSETGVTAYIDDNNNLAFKSSSNFTLHAGTSNILDVACIKLSQNSNPTTIKSGINYENTGTLAGSASIITTGITEAEAIAQGYTVIKTAEDLQNINNNLSGRYILMNDIDLSGIDWTPIGAKENSFTGGFSGEFNGNGFTISNLNVNKELFESGDEEYSASQYIGLFGGLVGAKVINVNIANAEIYAGTYVGALAGVAENSIIDNCHVLSAQIIGTQRVGGLER